MGFIAEGVNEAFRLLGNLDGQTLSAVWVSVRTSTLSLVFSFILGAPLGFCLGHFTFAGRRTLRFIVDTLLSLPTVVIGLLFYALVTARGPLGGMGLLYSIPGMATAQTILALPMVIAIVAAGVEGLDKRLGETLRTLGANPRQAALTTLSEARGTLLVAAAAAYGRVISEVGISTMIGGNIKWHTRTMTTAIALETSKGQFGRGIALGLVLMLVALAVNLLLRVLRRRAA
ncbi:MAG: ABC transporter permease [Desulfovibrionaceae bacterium]